MPHPPIKTVGEITREKFVATAMAGVPKSLDLSKILFEKQLSFGQSTSRLQTACCTRRSGKTVAELVKLLDVVGKKPGSVGLYITRSRINAKRIAWEILKDLNTSWKMGGDPLEGELCMVMPNNSRIYLTGCTDLSEVENFRGLPLAIVVIDETQSFPTLLLQKLVDEVLMPALMDFAGLLVLVGTPGPVPVGYFYNCVTSPEWAHFAWSVFDNPHIERKSGQTPQQLLDAELKRRGVDVNDPVIQREWFGRWVLDPNALVFRYDPATNHRLIPPSMTGELHHQHHVIGLDFGYSDSDAVAVLGWSDNSPTVDLVEEVIKGKQHITPLMAKVREMEAKYKPLAIVADFASLGKKIAEEISTRTQVPVEAADKMRKLEHIEWLNDAMRTNVFFAPRHSRFAQDAALVEWDKTNPEKPKISSRFHSDICDAVLYAYVRALHWLHVPKPENTYKRNTPEWFAAQNARVEAEFEAQLEAEFKANREQQREDSAWE